MRLFIFLLTLFSTTSLYAMTLSEAVEMALSKSEQSEIIQASEKISIANANRIATFTLPQIRAKAHYLDMQTNAEDNPFFPFQDTDYSASLEASQLLWSGGKIWNSHKLKNSLQVIATFQKQTDEALLIKQVSDAYLKVAFQQALLDILNDRVKQRATEHQDATDLFEAGMVTHLDVREAELNLNISKNDLTSGNTDYQTAVIEFNLLLGIEDQAQMLIPSEVLNRNIQIDQNLDKLTTLIENGQQLNVKLASENIRSAESRYKLDSGDYYPSIALVASGESSGAKTSEMDESLSIGIQLQWDIFSGGETNAKRAASKSEIMRSTVSLRKLKKDLTGSIDKLRNEAISIDEQIKVQEKSVTLSNENYEDARALYGSGQINLTRLGTFNLNFAESRFKLIQLYYIENSINLSIEQFLY